METLRKGPHIATRTYRKMRYDKTAENLAEEYISKPIEYGTEADLRVQLHYLLSDYLNEKSQIFANVEEPKLVGETRSYKQAYKQNVESKLKQKGSISRIRLDTSVDKRRQYDLVCFNETIKSPISWVRSGSKRFDEEDLDAAFGIKYIKNKCYPPIRRPITDDALLEMDSKELQSVFNAKENSIGGDIEDLNSLPSDVTAIFILISNNNYLFSEPLSAEEQRERKKQQAGLGARKWLQSSVEDTAVLYVHPYGMEWIARPNNSSK